MWKLSYLKLINYLKILLTNVYFFTITEDESIYSQFKTKELGELVIKINQIKTVIN